MNGWAALAPLIMGLHKSRVEYQNAPKNAAFQAEIARWSPWSGIAPNIGGGRPDSAGPVMQGGLASAQMYNDMQQQDRYNQLMEQMMLENTMRKGSNMSGWGDVA